MKLTVKTLKGEKFPVEAEPSSTIAQVKGLIEAAKKELPAATMKLIHSGKVLKDEDTIESCNIKENDFLVVMITKAKKPAAAASPAPAPAATTTTTTAAAPAAAASTPATPAAAPANSTTTPAAASAPSNPPPAPAQADNFSAEAVSSLTAMGFPEAEVKACLRAANGNPDVAVEFLTNGIPEAAQQQQSTGGAGSSSSSSGSGAPLEALRNHPQFDALRRLVQSNPQMLQQVLTQIGQQQPELLQEINANQARFLEMMNEPVSDAPAPAAPSGGSSSPAAPTGGSSSSPANPMAGMMEGMANPAQMAQMLQNMSPEEMNQMAAMMGITPEQLQATARMIGQIPPDQLEQYMMQAMQSGGMGGMLGGAGGGGPGGAGGGFQPQVLRLNEEEMAAVDRLTEMGFDRAEAAQAFLACDKNEALAANLLMDGGFGFGGGGDNNTNGNSGGGSGGGSGGADDGDDMYE